jgi:predicted ATPase/DNA-binding SARP family transcriptional activator/tetratricopeptide (TPR) repeat protein
MEVRLLGSMEALDEGGGPLAVPGAKVRALLALLALDCGRVVPTDRLIDGLWQDDPPAGVTNALQRLVSKLRKSLGSGELVAMRPPGYVLALEPEAVDVHRLERLIRAARGSADQGDLDNAVATFAEAEALWRGAPLADFAYDEFAQPHITRLEELHLSSIEDRVDAELALGHLHLVGELEVLVAEHPVRERLRGQLMVALYRAGRQADALRVFQDGRAVLAEELGLDPGPELRHLESAILSQDPSLDPPAHRAVPAPPAAPARRTNLRPTLSSLVGRTTELAEVVDLVAAHRLVTIVGPGGAGKTRLATEVAHRSLDDGAADVVLVELAAIGDQHGVAGSVAAAFELPEPAVDPLTRVAQHCEGRDVLLVLDNCEHLVDAAAQVVDALLQQAPRMRIVTTSREALRVPGEAVWVVPPLQATDGVELFVERASAADTGFHADDDRLLIEDICARLDGLPLAIELAAARTRAFTAGQIAERLDDRFRLLTGGARTAMARQQTLRAVVDWSYALLFEDERRVFERLSVYPAGCTLAGAEAVCADGDLDAAEVAEYVASLVDKSLLLVDRSGGTPRYRMLQTLNQYGRERLVERGEADAAFARMAAHLAELCARSRDAFRGIDQREWFREVDVELDNIRTAFEWALGAEEKELAVTIAAELTFYRWVAGGSAEGFRWMNDALALDGDVDPFTLGRALAWQGFVGFITGNRDGYDDSFQRGVALLREHGDPVFAGYALSFYTQLVQAIGQVERSAALNHELLDLLHASADPWARPAARWVEAALAIQERGDFAAYEEGLQEAGAAYREVGDQFMTAVCMDLVAELAENRGDLDATTFALNEALDIVAGWRMRTFEAALSARLARVAVQHLAADAEALVQHALVRSEDLSYLPARAITLNALANLRRREGRLDDAEQDARDALALYRGALDLRFSSSFSRAPSPLDVPVGAATALSVLGFVAEARGDAAEAIACHQAAFDELEPEGHPRITPLALEGLAAATALAGDAEQAAQLLERSDDLRAAFGAGRTAAEELDVARTKALLSGPLRR